jgi:DNA-binding transcriptional MerR regulator
MRPLEVLEYVNGKLGTNVVYSKLYVWENEYLTPMPKLDEDSKQRVFTMDEVKKIMDVVVLKELQFTNKQIRDIQKDKKMYRPYIQAKILKLEKSILPYAKEYIK